MEAANKNYTTHAVYRTWLMLKITFTLVPIIIGLDKCITWLITDWAQYSSPQIMALFHVTVYQYVFITGLPEIFAGIITWFYPRLGGYLIAFWMVLVIINLATLNQFYDIIARDAVIALAALALAWLSESREIRRS